MPRFLAGPARTLTRFGERPRYREGLYELGGGAHVWLVPNGSWGETNLGLVVCGQKSVLIDTAWDLHFMGEMLLTAQELLGAAPVEHVINTHADGDHCWSNQLFADKSIIATEACAKNFCHVEPRQLHYTGAVGRYLAYVRVGGLDAFGRYMHHMFAPYDLRDLKLTPPNQPFKHERVLRVGGIDFVITETGPGHTDGDCMVFLPDQQVLYAGDILFVESTPVAWVGPIENIVAALKRVLELQPRVIVPGHGRLADARDVQAVIDYWEFVQTELWTRHAAGMPSHEAARDLLLGPRFAASPFARWDSPERIVTTAYTLYRGWGASPKRRFGVATTLRQQAELALELPEATPRVMHQR